MKFIDLKSHGAAEYEEVQTAKDLDPRRKEI